MSDRDAFLRAIRERPDADGPRLVYADWLEEQGDPRGEFIRIQCELAKLPPWDPRRPALEEREADLLAAHDYDWLGRPPGQITEWGFKRGFVERFTVTDSTLSGLEGLLAESVYPHVTFAVSATSGHLRRVLESPHLEELGGFDWNEPVPFEQRDTLVLLVSSPRLCALRRLGVRGLATRVEFLEILNQRPGAINLAELVIDGLSATEVACFERCRGLNNVQSLELYRSADRAFMHEVGQTPFRWRKLDFGPSRHTTVELAGLVDCRRLEELRVNVTNDLSFALPTSIRRLHLNQFTPMPLPAALPRLDVLPSLEWLHVRVDRERRSVDANEGPRLAAVLQRLKGPVFHLEAVSHGLTLAYLASVPAQDRFRKLFFVCDDVTDSDVRALIECGGFTNLQSLHLYCPRLTSRHVEMLAEMPFPPSLRRLSIQSPVVDDTSLAKLFRSSYLQRLTSINLRECQVGAKTLTALAKSPVLTRLRELIVPYGGELSRADWEAFCNTPGLSPLFRLRGR